MKILFIGNSHTYFNDMPYIFKQICTENGIEIDVTMLARGYKGLDYHCKEPATRFNILYGEYDYVILQHLQSGFDKEILYNSTLKIKEFINMSPKTKPLLYMTWTLKNEEFKQKEMTEGYLEVGKKLNIPVVPVGIVWWKFFKEFPFENLYFKDDKHASKLGSILVAYTIYNKIFGKRSKTQNPLYQEINRLAEEAIKEFQ